MLLGDLERLVDAFLDRDRGDDDDELGEAIELVQLEDRPQVDIGLPVPVSISTVKSPEASAVDGARPLRS